MPLTMPILIAIRGSRRRQLTRSPTTATMTATCSRPHKMMPPKAPTSHQRWVLAAHDMPAMPRMVTVCGQSPLAATLHTGVANPKVRTATRVSRAPTTGLQVTYMMVRVTAVSRAAVRAPGTREKVSPPKSAYAGSPATTTPGDRPISVWPLAPSITQAPRTGLSASHEGSCTPSIQGTPAVAIRHEAKCAVHRSVLTHSREAVTA